MDKEKEVVIVGAGGFGWEVFSYLKDSSSAFVIKGFIDDDLKKQNVIEKHSTYLGTIKDYQPSTSEQFLLAIGQTPVRVEIANNLERKGASFATYVHPLANVSKLASLGEGSIVCPFSTVGATAKIGKYALLNVNTYVAHDCILEDNAVLSPYATVNGYVTTGKHLFMGTRATLLPSITIGQNVLIGAHSYCKETLPDNTFYKTEFNHKKRGR